MILSSPLRAQSGLPASAEKRYQDGDYAGAIPIYRKSLKTQTVPQDELMQRLAECYRRVHRYDSAAWFYDAIFRGGKGTDAMLKVYGESQIRSGNLSSGRNHLSKYVQAYPTDIEARASLALADSVFDFLSARKPTEIFHLQVNGPGPDVGPSYWEKGLYFASIRPEWLQHDGSGNPNVFNIFNIEVIPPRIPGKLPLYFQARPIMGKASAAYNESSPCFDTLSHEIALSRCTATQPLSPIPSPGDPRWEIWTGKVGAQSWQNLSPFPWNSPNFSCLHPYLSPDGGYMLFAANDPAGEGGYDLFISFRTAHNGWEKPRNLGPGINTRGDELWPWVHAQSGELIYCSNRIGFYEGFDLVHAVAADSFWRTPVPFEGPINTPYDEFSLIMSPDRKEGYFSSNRPRGLGDFDLYYFRVREFPMTCSPAPDSRFTYLLEETDIPADDTLNFDYTWYIGKDIVRKGARVRHSFPAPGTYDIRLEIHDRLLGNELEPKAFTLEIKGESQVLIAAPQRVYAGEPVKLDGSGSFLNGSQIMGFLWDTGTGDELEGARPTYTWKTPGTYRLSLRIAGFDANYTRTEKICGYKEIVVLPRR